jgi:hypothetical protein
MTIFGAFIELVLLTLFLSCITVICKLADVSTATATMALILAGVSYALTVITRTKVYNHDKHAFQQ